MDDEEYRRLKETYKDHYRKINEMKKRLAGLRTRERIHSALNDMNKEDLMHSLDDAVLNLKEKVAMTEARLSVALEQLRGEDNNQASTPIEDEESIRKEKARQTIETMKNSLGTLQAELEEKARNMKTIKTIGPGTKKDQDDIESGERNPQGE